MPTTPTIPEDVMATPEPTGTVHLTWSPSLMGEVSQVDIGAADFIEYHDDERIPTSARLSASKDFKAKDGTFIESGDPYVSDRFYQNFGVTMNGSRVQVNAGQAYSTTDSDQPDVVYSLDLYDQDGTFICNLLHGLRIPPDKNPTTWQEITAYSKGKPLRNPPTYLDSNAIMELIDGLVDVTQKASSVQLGVTKLDVDPDIAPSPIAVGINSPLLTASAGLGVAGRVELDIAPVDPDHPIAVGKNSKALEGLRPFLSADYANDLAAAVAAIGSTPTTLWITSPCSVNADLDVPTTIALAFSGTGKITIAAGKRLIVRTMIDPGSYQIFVLTDANSHVLFARNTTQEINIAWFTASNEGGDATRAINEALYSTSFGQDGGVIYIPPTVTPWTTTGGHMVPFGTTIRGRMGDPYNSKIQMAAANTFMFKVQDYFVDHTRFEYLSLSSTGQANNIGIAFESHSSGGPTDSVISQVTFVDFNRSISGIGGASWINIIEIDRCRFFGAVDCDIYWDESNGMVTVSNCQFNPNAGNFAVEIWHCGLMKFRENEVNGSGTGSGFVHIFGYFVNITFEGNEDEGPEFFLVDEAITGSVRGVVNFTNGFVASRMVLNGDSTYVSRGMTYYFHHPFEDKNTPNANPSSHVFSRSDTCLGHDRSGGADIIPAPMANFTHGCLMSCEDRMGNSIERTILSNDQWIIERPPQDTYRDPNKALHLVGSTRPDRDLVAWGSLGSDPEGDISGYKNRMNGVTGRLEWRYTHVLGGTWNNYGGFVFNNFPFVYVPQRPAQIVANMDNYNPGATNKKILINSDAARDITGLTFTSDPTDGQEHEIINIGNFAITLKHQSSSSLSNYRFINSTGADIVLNPDQGAYLSYDGTRLRWRVFKRS